MRSRKKCLLAVLALIFLSTSVFGEEEEMFKDTEVRVIRPRYFNKKYRFEIGVQTAVITNQAFYYTFVGSGFVGFHISEQFGLELVGGYGVSRENADRVILQEDFEIDPEFAPIENYYGGSFLWTPMYGKYQLGGGHLVYFDTFLSAGGGLLSVREDFSYCPSGAGKASSLIQYPYFEFGVGQRFFLSKNDSIRWDIKAPMYYYNTADFACSDGASGETDYEYNVNFQVGYSRFI